MAPSPQFFKIILQTTLDLGKLMIPRKFVSECGEVLSSPIFLRLPNEENAESEWKVELTTSKNGFVWLNKGWHEFEKFLSLEHGSFLVFRYDGNSRFCVTVFEKSGLEIEYPSNDFSHGCKLKVGGEFQDDDSIEILEVGREFQDDDAGFSHDHTSKKMRVEDFSGHPKFEFEEGRKLPLPDGKVEASESYENHPMFRVVMRQSYLYYRYALVISRPFARRHFLEKSGSISIQIPKGRTWPLEYQWCKSGNYAYISHGWKKFAKDNGLKQGDVGIFKLIDKDKLLFTKEIKPFTT